MYVTGTTEPPTPASASASQASSTCASAAMSAIEQPAARSGRTTCWSGRGEDVGRLGHEVHAAEHDELRLRAGRRLAGELERVTGDVGELDDLVALVVVAEHERPGRRAPPWRPGPARPGRGRRRRAASRGSRRPRSERGSVPRPRTSSGRSVVVTATSLHGRQARPGTSRGSAPLCRYGVGGFMPRSAEVPRRPQLQPARQADVDAPTRSRPSRAPPRRAPRADVAASVSQSRSVAVRRLVAASR